MLFNALSAVGLIALFSQNVSGFVPLAPTSQSTASSKSSLLFKPSPLALSSRHEETESSSGSALRKAGASLVAAALIAGNVLSVAPALAVMHDDASAVNFGGGTSQVLAARSGGRAGGRARSAPAARSSSRSTNTNTRVIERTRYVPTPGVMGGGYGYGAGPGIIIAPPLYNPYPGLGECLVWAVVVAFLDSTHTILSEWV